MTDSAKPPLSITCSPGFTAWLSERGIALAITTYQAGRLLLVGVNKRGKLMVHHRHFARAMGAWSNGRELWLATRYQLWQLVDMWSDSEGGDTPRERLYLPKTAHSIGDVDTHDVAVDGDGSVLLVPTLMNCLAKLDERASFAPLWRPAWVDEWVAEDRAHVNGLAIVDGVARFCTACGETNTRKGWKTNRESGGVVVDIESNKVVCRDLSMPHSPRWHDGRLWLLNSGFGQFGFVDSGGQFQSVAFCPGYLRGLAFVDHWALVGLSRPRHKTFVGLPLDSELARQELDPQTGVVVVDYSTGRVDHWLRIEGPIVELYDVVVLPGTTRARCLSLKNDDLQRNLWMSVDDSTEDSPSGGPPRRFTSRRSGAKDKPGS